MDTIPHVDVDADGEPKPFLNPYPDSYIHAVGYALARGEPDCPPGVHGHSLPDTPSRDAGDPAPARHWLWWLAIAAGCFALGYWLRAR